MPSGHTMLSNSSEPWANLWSPEGVPSANKRESQLTVLHEYKVYFLQTLFNRKKIKPTGTGGRNPKGHGHKCTKAVSTKQQPGLSVATSQAASKIHVREGLNTEGARLIDCDIIPQEKWGKPHCANHFNQDLPSPLETSMQEGS